jgi:hypothetical protein
VQRQDHDYERDRAGEELEQQHNIDAQQGYDDGYGY